MGFLEPDSYNGRMAFPRRQPSIWKLRTQTLALGGQTRVMGVVNVTPDSFSDGGRFPTAASAVECALAMFEDGAAIVDVGGESTRPGAHPLDSAEESHRVLPVIEGILAARPQAMVSVDTYRAETALAALQAGAEIVNDVSGLLWDAGMGPVVAKAGCGFVLMHTRGRPDEWRRLPRMPHGEVVPLVRRELSERLRSALDAGVDRAHIVLDPGLGFGKRFDENFPLLANLGDLKALGQPILAGASRKSFLGRALAPLRAGADAGVHERENASLAAAVIAILAGADLVRAHDVRATVEAAAVADAVLREGLGEAVEPA